MTLPNGREQKLITGFRLVVTALLLLSAGPAAAEWIPVVEMKARDGIVYGDSESARRKGDLVTIWVLYDYRTMQTRHGQSFVSMRAQNEYDCEKERVRSLAETRFSGNMASGEILFDDAGESQWSPIPPGTVPKY
jgi:hypothetical protein